MVVHLSIKSSNIHRILLGSSFNFKFMADGIRYSCLFLEISSLLWVMALDEYRRWTYTLLTECEGCLQQGVVPGDSKSNNILLDCIFNGKFMPTGTLDSQAFFGKRSLLYYTLRPFISIRSAYALFYLHQMWKQFMVQRINTFNIFGGMNCICWLQSDGFGYQSYLLIEFTLDGTLASDLYVQIYPWLSRATSYIIFPGCDYTWFYVLEFCWKQFVVHPNLVQLKGWCHDKDETTHLLVYEFMLNASLDTWSYVLEFSWMVHPNLMQLKGWCQDKDETTCLLVYEFMANGSLHSHLFGKRPALTWELRYKIYEGLTYALFYLDDPYLNQGWKQCVVHRGIKSSNILLDSSFNVKLGSFGLARLMDPELGPETTGLAGTFGRDIKSNTSLSCWLTREMDHEKGPKRTEKRSFSRMRKDYKRVQLEEWVSKLDGQGRLLLVLAAERLLMMIQCHLQRLLQIRIRIHQPHYRIQIQVHSL